MSIIWSNIHFMYPKICCCKVQRKEVAVPLTGNFVADKVQEIDRELDLTPIE